ncbi:glycosyltransferase family 4 protein [Sphingobacterium sp. N143]|uniref:glycosyltransferase family 4 protein n=1 Tax=Sphingobacterium sp. N143 TaxID=2746727 RepID=UPI002578A9A9|nr:glycosyltransferase family 4 protein [Sphingobacterium sp. N143]MDM1295933.1 glycosyltransferase family 4 protein [Sphingobacterium sp. N143]
MNLIFYVEARYIRDDSGNVYNLEGVMKLSLWERYLEVFDSIIIVARVKHVPGYIGHDGNLANGEKVSFFELPYFLGPLDFLKNRRNILKKIKESTRLKGAFLMRVPGQIGTLASKYLKNNGKEYGVEVVGDPYDVFSKGAVNHPLRLFFKYKYYYDLKRVVSNASSTLYVTEKTLQKRYPPRNGMFTTFASNVILKAEYFKKEVREVKSFNNVINLISIGSLEQMYKAPDVVLKSLQLVNSCQEKYRVKLTWIGAGKYMGEMIRLAKELGINEYVDFLGYIGDKEKVIEELDKADVFILASRTEGLPRVIVEAMARSLPVIGTNVGGIPELIKSEYLVIKDSPYDLASKIKELIEMPELANAAAHENIERAREFSEEILKERRHLFYRSLSQH